MSQRNIWDFIIPFRIYPTWRDMIDVLVLIGFIVVTIYLITSSRRKPNRKWKNNWSYSRYLWFAIGIVVICSLWLSTAKYKDIRMDIATAEHYEEIGNYHMAYSIYIDLRLVLGDYQDLDERIARLYDLLND